MKHLSLTLKKLFVCAALCAGYSRPVLYALEHTVQKGETLYSISRKYALSVDELCRLNSISRDAILKTGQKLSVPSKEDVSGSAATPESARAKVSYKVQKGDTLYGVAKKYGLSVAELRQQNGLDESNVLKAGQTLTVFPRSESTGAAAPLPAYFWPMRKPFVKQVKGKISGVELSAEGNGNVAAVNGGAVTYSGVYRGFGQVVFVQSSNGYTYIYTGLEKLHVGRGDSVAAGDVLGITGVDSASGLRKLTFMVYHNGEATDPAFAPRG
ncbi:M23 family metallopeptidase [Treponema endosymbiont of Eucomonympha sp.]|uniref:M23 family metallopeptidase n=1 Tax=Treponema endosymbiont of Eucomonympha sp. TaxID=1580831 RepID=UPI000781C22C|nr:M23 family metallopeptidase [Treponema endosymbiont of Eucomonympha sp.]